MGSLPDVAAFMAIALGAGLIVCNDEVAQAITRRLGITRWTARLAARALCLTAGIAVAALGVFELAVTYP